MKYELRYEGNKTIAIFMGWHPYDKYKINPLDSSVFWTPSKNASHNVCEMKFDSDWSWLMPVVEKIDSMDRLNNEHNGFIKTVTDCKINTDIETIFLLVYCASIIH